MSRESSSPMAVVEIPEDSTAATIEYTFVTNGVPDDLSSASGPIYFHASDVNGAAVVTNQSASFTGGMGEVETAMNSAIMSHGPRDLYCEFEVQGFNQGNLISYTFILRILKRSKVT